MAAHSSVLAWEIPWTATVQRIIKSWTRLSNGAQAFEQAQSSHLSLLRRSVVSDSL